jgi:hypothetical protein
MVGISDPFQDEFLPFLATLGFCQNPSNADAFSPLFLVY